MRYRNPRTVQTPKKFVSNNYLRFFNDFSFVFNLVNSKEAGFTLNLEKTKECSVLGVLLVYKFMEFSVRNDCFWSPKFIMGEDFNNSMKKYGFVDLMNTYINGNNPDKELVKLKVSVKGDFIIAPQALLSNDKVSSDKLNKNFLPKIKNYYSYNDKVVKMIFSCFSEVFLNFWAHAEDQNNSIIVAYGNKDHIEIACADNGKGILTTLKQGGKFHIDNHKTFLSSLEKNVTSKSMSNHMGHGLWGINEIVKRTNGTFHIYSEGYFYQSQNASKIVTGKVGFWQGTVVYLKIPLDSPISWEEVVSDVKDLKLKVDWI